MKTTLHTYYFNVREPDQAAAYRALVEKLTGLGYRDRWHHVIADTKRDSYASNVSEEVELDTTHFFSNQWNKAGEKGRRLFDWYEGIFPNRDIKRGHWLEITPEMDALRKTTTVCGYCGKYGHVDDGKPFHEACLGSEYLKESEINLLRMLPVALQFPKRAPLTESEAADLVPKYRVAQGLGKVTREEALKAKTRQKVASLVPNAKAKGEQLVKDAETEAEALTWLLDNGVNIIDNTIFYHHTQKFSFGWRTPLTAAEKSALLDILVEFPFEYEIKSA